MQNLLLMVISGPRELRVGGACACMAQLSKFYGPGTTHSSYEMREKYFILTMHSTHFIYGYMASHIWLRTILIVRKETCCHHIGYSYRLTARVLLYAPSHREDSTYHSLCYTRARCSSVVRAFAHGAMGCRIDPSWAGPIELFLIPASAPRLV